MLWCLPWYTPRSEKLKLKSCRNLIDHYLGNFLSEKLTVEQLSVNLFHGTGTVRDISLDCKEINVLGKERKWPVEIVEGHVEDITVRVPWSNLLKEESRFIVNGLKITLHPKSRAEPASSILKWTLENWSKWSSRKRVLINYKKQDTLKEPETGKGAEMFADSIDIILQRLKIKLENTKIRIEHVPKDIDIGIALDIHIKNIDYYDEAVPDPVPVSTEQMDCSTYILNTYTNKKIKFEGVTLYTEEFPINQKKHQNMHEHNNIIIENSNEPQNVKAEDIGIIIPETSYSIPAIEFNPTKDLIPTQNSETLKQTAEKEMPQPSSILFAILNGQQELTLTLKNTDQRQGPVIKGETYGPFIVVLSPKRLDSIIKLIDCLTPKQVEEVSTAPTDMSCYSNVQDDHRDVHILLQVIN